MPTVRDRLIDAGVMLLETDGLDALSLRRIARTAGVSHGAPRHHFPAYESLLAAVARRGLEDLGREMAPHLTADAERKQATLDLARAYLDFARRRPAMFALITRHDLLDGAGGQLRQITGPWFDRLIELTGDPTSALALWSGVHGLAILLAQRTAEPLADPLPSPDHIVRLLVARLVS